MAGLALGLFHRQTREVVESGLRDTAHALSLAIDREVGISIATLQALGTSGKLEQGDLSGFRRRALKVLATRPAWDAIVLYAPDGRQLMNTRLQIGSPSPVGGALPYVLQAVNPGVVAATSGRVSAVQAAIIHYGLNDLAAYGTARTGLFTESMRAILSRLRAASMRANIAAMCSLRRLV